MQLIKTQTIWYFDINQFSRSFKLMITEKVEFKMNVSMHNRDEEYSTWLPANNAMLIMQWFTRYCELHMLPKKSADFLACFFFVFVTQIFLTI